MQVVKPNLVGSSISTAPIPEHEYAMVYTQINPMLFGDPEVGFIKLGEHWRLSFSKYHPPYAHNRADFCISIGHPQYTTKAKPVYMKSFCCCSEEDSSNIKGSGLTCFKCEKMQLPSKFETVYLNISFFSGSKIGEVPRRRWASIDVVALCYTAGDRVSLENAVHKWYPMIQYHCDRVPIILLGVDPRMSCKMDDGELEKFGPRYSEELNRAVQEIDPVQHVEYILPDADFGSTAAADPYGLTPTTNYLTSPNFMWYESSRRWVEEWAADGNAAIPRVSSVELGEILAWHGYHRNMEKWLERGRGGCVVL